MPYLWQQQEYLRLSYQLYTDSVVAVAELFNCHILQPVVPVPLFGSCWFSMVGSCWYNSMVGWSGQYFLAAP